MLRSTPDDQSGVSSVFFEYSPVPAARKEQISHTRVGDELVIFDAEHFHYHTLNGTAARVWELCDGVRTTAELTRETGLAEDAVRLSVAELGEAGLLESPADSWDAKIERRRVLKIAAAGLLGGVLLPAVASITAPDALAVGTQCRGNDSCVDGECCSSYSGTCQPLVGAGEDCDGTCQCPAGTCCKQSGKCLNRGSGKDCR